MDRAGAIGGGIAIVMAALLAVFMFFKELPETENGHAGRREAPPRPRQEAPPRPRQDAPPRPRQEAPPRPRQEAPPGPPQEAPPRPRQEAAPRPRQEASTSPQGTSRPGQEASTSPQGTSRPRQEASTSPQGTSRPPQEASTSPQGTSRPPQEAATPPEEAPESISYNHESGDYNSFNNNMTCTICHDEIQQRFHLKTLACGHCFHTDCLRRILRQQKTGQCPECGHECSNTY